MVFSWGQNSNHQLGLSTLDRDQPLVVKEPALVEDLLQFSCIRKVKCQGNKTMVLVDEPNLLLVFSKKDRVTESLLREESHFQEPEPRFEDAEIEGEGSQELSEDVNVEDSPAISNSLRQISHRGMSALGAEAGPRIAS